MSTPILLALVSVILTGLSTVIQRVLMKDSKLDDLASSITFQVFCAIIVFLFAIFTSGYMLPSLKEYGLNFVFTTVLYGTGSLFLFRSLRYIEASDVTIINTSRAFWTILLGVTLLDDSFSVIKFAGALIIICAVFIVTSEKGKFSVNKGTIYALINAACFGLAVPNDAYILRNADALSYTTLSFLLPGIALFIANPKVTPKFIPIFELKTLLKMVFLCVIYAGNAIAFYKALEYGAQASQLGAILQSSVIVTVIFATVFLKERDRIIRKSIALALVFIGVYFLR